MQLTKRIRARYSLLLALFFITGCGQNSIYEKIYEKPKQRINCLTIENKKDLLSYILLKNPTLKKLQKSHCPFLLKPTAHFVTTCTSAQAKALGSDFDGFLRLELFENGKLLYRNQKDFKGCLRPSVVEELVQRMKESLAIQSDKEP